MNIEWTEYFMTMAYLTAMKSKDPRTKIGAVVVTPDNNIIAQGYNGLPRGINYKNASRLVSPEKYFWFEHGERNAIYSAARNGIKLLGSTMYTQGTPCADCGRAIIQAGIKKVVVHTLWEKTNHNEKWIESGIRTTEMLDEAGVKLVKFNGRIISELMGFFDGKVVKLNE